MRDWVELLRGYSVEQRSVLRTVTELARNRIADISHWCQRKFVNYTDDGRQQVCVIQAITDASGSLGLGWDVAILLDCRAREMRLGGALVIVNDCTFPPELAHCQVLSLLDWLIWQLDVLEKSDEQLPAAPPMTTPEETETGDTARSNESAMIPERANPPESAKLLERA